MPHRTSFVDRHDHSRSLESIPVSVHGTSGSGRFRQAPDGKGGCIGRAAGGKGADIACFAFHLRSRRQIQREGGLALQWEAARSGLYSAFQEPCQFRFRRQTTGLSRSGKERTHLPRAPHVIRPRYLLRSDLRTGIERLRTIDHANTIGVDKKPAVIISEVVAVDEGLHQVESDLDMYLTTETGFGHVGKDGWAERRCFSAAAKNSKESFKRLREGWTTFSQCQLENSHSAPWLSNFDVS